MPTTTPATATTTAPTEADITKAIVRDVARISTAFSNAEHVNSINLVNQLIPDAVTLADVRAYLDKYPIDRTTAVAFGPAKQVASVEGKAV